MIRLFLVLAFAWPSLSFGLVAVSAHVSLPKREPVSRNLPSLSIAWPANCSPVQATRPLTVRMIQGAVSNQQVSCESNPPLSSQQWDTLVARFWMWGRLWTFEMRESADLVLATDKDLNVRVDLAPAPDAGSSNHITLSNLQLVFAPNEDVICSAKLFDVTARVQNARVHGRVCEIGLVELDFAAGS